MRDDPEVIFDFKSGREVWSRPPAIEVDDACRKISVVRGNKIKIYPYLDTASTIEYEYTESQDDLTFDGVSATDSLVIPVEFCPVICDMALYYLYTDKNEPRATIAEKDAQRTLKNMVDFYGGLSKVRVRPRKRDAVGYRR